MNKKIIDLLAPYYAVSIIGMAKNAGKTTVLNRLVSAYDERGIIIGLTSIGRDGENVDVVTSTDKPEIYVTKGTVVATAAELLKKSDITKEILKTTGINTPLGEVVFVRAKSDGNVQIGGGSINSQIAKLCGEFKEFGAEKVLIDGAVSRKTVSGPGITDATILCTGAALSLDMDKVVEDTAFAASLLMLPPLCDEHAESLISRLPESQCKVIAIMPGGEYVPVALDDPAYIKGQVSYIYIRGAVSDKVVEKLVMSNINLRGVKIIIDDGSKLFIKSNTFEKLKRKNSEIVVRRHINLVALTVNPCSTCGLDFNKARFAEAMQKHISVPVFNVLDEEVMI